MRRLQQGKLTLNTFFGDTERCHFKNIFKVAAVVSLLFVWLSKCKKQVSFGAPLSTP